jgi:hypothetical protein
LLDPDDTAGVDLDATTEWPTFRTALLSHMASDQVITAYDLYRYEGGIATRHDHSSVTHAGTDTDGHLPLQVACVLTLRTATLSRRGRGRLYLPTCGASMMSGSLHMFLESAVDTLVDDFANYLSMANTGGRVVSVVSRTGSSSEPVTSVDADLVPDTQRRRRDKLTSARHSASL